MSNRPWLRWVIALAVIVVLAGIGTHAATGIVQEPYMIQAQAQEGDGWNYALVITQHDPTTADIEKAIRTFAEKTSQRPVVAEIYIDGNAAISFEGGGPADTSAAAAAHVGEFKRPQSGNGQGWANAKGAQDSGRVTFQAS